MDEAVNPRAAYEESFYLPQRECVDAMLGQGTVTPTAAGHMGSLEPTFAAYDSAKPGGITAVR